MQSVLFIKNNYYIDSKLQELLEEDYMVYIAENVHDALEIVSANYIAVFVILSSDYIQDGSLAFVQQLYEQRSTTTPIIFSTETLTDGLNYDCLTNGWYFLPFPIMYDFLLPILKKAMLIADAMDDQIIVVKKYKTEYEYRVADIILVQRIRNRYIRIYSRNAETNEIEINDFFFSLSLGQFITHFGIRKYLVQCNQSWIVNHTDIKIVDPTKMNLTLNNGTTVPSSSKYIRNFLKSKRERY